MFKRILPFDLPRFSKTSPQLLFVAALFLVMLVENSLAFVFPIVTEITVNSTTMVGLIMASSSVVSLILDFALPKLLKDKTWKFQFLSAAIIACFFPIFTALGKAFSVAAFFVLGSMVWGIYFELLAFAQQNFIATEEKKIYFSRDWGIIYLIRALACIVGPILGAQLLAGSSWNLAITYLVLQGVGIMLAIIGMTFAPTHRVTRRRGEIQRVISFIKEVSVWRIFFSHILPVIMMGIMVSIIDALYWVLGGLFSQTIPELVELEWVPIVLYAVPMMVGSLFVSRLNIHVHKKRYSQLALIAGGALLLPLMLMAENVIAIVGIMLISSLLFSLMGPLNDAVFTDLQARAGEYGQDLVGLNKMTNSIAYIVTPILVGLISDYWGFAVSFTVVGAVAIVVGVVLLLLTPRKLLVPHAELESVEIDS
ncbi:MAG TPA: MFS transporter [Vitreimonas sp.]|nr:MFS transporter [Vitreimonas sp.]